MGGGEAIEALSLLHRALACPSPPRLVIISLDPGHFSRPDMFWERSVRFGFVTDADIADVAARRPGKPAIRRSMSRNSSTGCRSGCATGCTGSAFRRCIFPAWRMAACSCAGASNQRWLAETLAARGHYYFGTDPGSTASSRWMATWTRSGRLPILDHYFDRLLAELDRRGIEARFIAMPVNQTTWHEVNPAVRDRVRRVSGGL